MNGILSRRKNPIEAPLHCHTARHSPTCLPAVDQCAKSIFRDCTLVQPKYFLRSCEIPISYQRTIRFCVFAIDWDLDVFAK